MSKTDAGARQWRIAEFDVKTSQEEMAGWLMMQLGANGCEMHAAKDGAGGSERSAVHLRATFEMDALAPGEEDKVAAALEEYGLSESVASLSFGTLDEEDWLAKWKEGFEPFTIGDRLLVTPPWHLEKLSQALTDGRAVVVIEPGLAFGTGFHETTRFCLKALQWHVDAAKKIVDVGSGSGILSIACALLHKSVPLVALETDPVACKNARQNFQLNGIASRIDMREFGTDKYLPEGAGTFDLILANLTYEDHAALLSEYKQLAKSGALVILAGILKEKGALMEEKLHEHGLSLVTREDGAAWSGFVARFP